MKSVKCLVIFLERLFPAASGRILDDIASETFHLPRHRIQLTDGCERFLRWPGG
jgi:hypothetical protein